jgi:transposase
LIIVKASFGILDHFLYAFEKQPTIQKRRPSHEILHQTTQFLLRNRSSHHKNVSVHSQPAVNHDPIAYALLKTIPGVGRIIALDILYEIENIRRFPRVQDFVSYCRLVKCAKESNGKIYGSSGKKIGNAHLRWAFSQASQLFLKGNDAGKRYHQKLVNKHNKGKALSILAHKLGRAVYFILKNQKPFDMNRFLNH